MVCCILFHSNKNPLSCPPILTSRNESNGVLREEPVLNVSCPCLCEQDNVKGCKVLCCAMEIDFAI